MFVIGAQIHDLTPDTGSYTQTVAQSLDTTRYYKVVTGEGETDIFPGSIGGTIPVKLNDQSQGGAGIVVTVSSGTLSIMATYPGIGMAQVIEYAEVIEDNTDVRAYVTNWLNPHPVTVQNWPSSYTVTGTVSLSDSTISSLATAIASAING